MGADNVELVLPATPEYAAIASFAAAGLASRDGFTCEDVEDLRAALSEICMLLLRGATGGESLHFSFGLDAWAFRIDAERRVASPAGASTVGSADDEAVLLESGGRSDAEANGHGLAAVVDDLTVGAGGATVRAMKRRSRSRSRRSR